MQESRNGSTRRERRHFIREQKVAIAKHYDVSNEFYELFPDKKSSLTALV